VGEVKPDGSQIPAVEGKDIQDELELPASNAMDPAEAQRLRIQADMDKIKVLDLARRREIAQLDMMGEYGSKVGSSWHEREHRSRARSTS
jgi:hypothetical protein